MKHNRLKYIYCWVFTAVAVMILLLGFGIRKKAGYFGHMNDYFLLTTEAGEEIIRPYAAKSGRCDVFLPSHADMNALEFVSDAGSRIESEGFEVRSGGSCGGLEPGGKYAYLTDDGEKTIRFMQSANTAALYADTASGSMERIHADKKNDEMISVRIVNAQGEADYSGTGSIKGHGNSTWFQPKKPYKLIPDSPAGMLGMGDAAQWVLISNVFDETSIRNSIAYELAASVGRYHGWSPEHAYADVYLNGEYAGLYQLTEKTGVGPGQLELAEGDCLFELMGTDRADALRSFAIRDDRTIEIVWPEENPADSVDAIKARVAEFEDALYAGNGICAETGRAWSDCIDMDSFARKYLVEEVLSNYDAGQNSQFFWLDASEDRIFAGPCWDYDLTLGKLWNTYWTTPYCLLAQRDWADGASWYGELMRREEFAALVARIYEEEFRPVLLRLMDTYIPELAAAMAPAVKMNNTRWSGYSVKGSLEGDAAEIIRYLRERMAFLDAVWLDKAAYCAVTLKADQVYNIYVPYGTVCVGFPKPEELNLSGVWYPENGDMPFDAAAPVYEDVTLVCRGGEEAERTEGFGTREDLIALLSIAALSFLLLCMMIADAKQRTRRRG